MSNSMHEGRLLVLDDDPGIGATIAAIAESIGMACQATTQAREFFAALDAWQPTHVALDLVMPGTDGIQILQQLADRNCPASIIITSGMDNRVLEAAHRSGTEHGLNIAGAVAKPFSLVALRSLLSQTRPDADASPAIVLATEDFEVTAPGLKTALAQDQFDVVFQPKVACATGELVGFEALARWHHALGGTIMPDRFIATAEQSGLIDGLTKRIINKGLEWMARDFSRSALTLSFNVSAILLRDQEFADRLADACAEHAIDASRLVLEITETSAMSDQVATLDLLTRLRLNGFHLSIDDFGVGYSSLVQLARLPFSELKIDKSFVMSAAHSAESRSIITAIVGLGRSLGLRTVAEGVEDLGVFSLLKDAGCDLAQGYFIGRPMNREGLMAWMGSPQAT
jgi:EAL domain-containing protein (putative c-di-GMP-specific phosphodiesterase class I)